MLKHALNIQAREAHEKLIISLTPHLSQESRKQIINSFNRAVDGDEPYSSAIIKRDRERLKRLLFKKTWQKQQK